MRFVPYRFRTIHRWWANLAGYFWKPCPLCGKPFGGHEWRDIDGKLSSVPNPMQQPWRQGAYAFTGQVGICPACTRVGRGVPVVVPAVDTEPE
ncbi:hypothetical protein ABZ949_02110 [Micromonospora tulbaghiae]|uniref:hypothetical protein n=1 Tax=Micromonospora tulbaghiae TaxID=479978 RepID=UPI003410AD60